jgi:hypothetical protein
MRKGTLGCGICDELTRSDTLGHFTCDTVEIGRVVRDLVMGLGVNADDIRGLGVQVCVYICLRVCMYVCMHWV